MKRHLALVSILVLAAASAAALTPATMLVIPAASRGPGAGTSVWQMDMFLGNAGSQSANVTMTWLERNTDNSGAPSVSVTVPAGRTMVLADVIQDRFGIDAGSGAILLTSNVPISATSRIYNLQGGVTFGQGFDGLAAPDNTPAGGERWITGLRQDGGSRSNLFAVAGPSGAELNLTARAPSGSSMGSASFTVPPWGALYAPLTDVVGGSPGDVTVVAAVSSGSAWIAGSRIDQASGDPFTAAASAADPTLFAPSQAAGTYLGSWFNQTFFSNGPAATTVTINPATGAATVTVDLGGNVFGGSDPPPETFSFMLSPGGGTFQTNSPIFGTTTTMVDARGRFWSDSPNVPAPGIDRFTASGIISAEQMLAGYTVFFPGGTTAEGMIRLVKQQ